jgi:hypothetical protein
MNISKFLQFVNINDLLLDPDLFRMHGMLEYWNVGVRVEQTNFNCKKLLQTHHSIIPLFQLGPSP